MSDLSEDHAKQIMASVEEWLEDDSKLFPTPEAAKGALYSSRKRRGKAWSRPKTCMYKGCTNQTVKSHTLQKSLVLNRIAEDGHVYSPHIDDSGELILRKIGIGAASTFQGFCETHENLFSDFERSGQIDNVRHAALQMYRTVCREIAIRKHNIEQMEIDLKDYLTRREAFLIEAVERVTGSTDAEMGSLTGDQREEVVKDHLSDSRGVLRELDKLYNGLSCEIDDKKSGIAGYTMKLPFEVPVALSGILLSKYRKRSERIRTAPCAIGILPQDGQCVAFILTLNNHSSFAKMCSEKLEKGPSALELFEGWMTHGSDHWFITPSVWEKLPLERQARVLADLQSTDAAAGADPSEPIFDDLRSSFLEAMEQQLESEESNLVLEQIIQNERLKLCGHKLKNVFPWGITA